MRCGVGCEMQDVDGMRDVGWDAGRRLGWGLGCRLGCGMRDRERDAG